MNKLTEMKATDPDDFTKPDCYLPCFSTAKKIIWDYIQARAPYEGPLVINMTKLARIVDYSRATVQHALKTFISCNLLEKTKQRKGRGNGSIFRLLWSFHPENETLPGNTTCYRPHPRKKLTKGSSVYSYSAYFFRKTLQKSQLQLSTTEAVGEIMNRLEGKLGKLAEDFYNWLIRKNLNMDRPSFYVFLAKELPPDREACFNEVNEEEKSEALKKFEELHEGEYYF